MGRLPWPVTGKVAVPYGEYKDPVFNIPVFKNGIEISTPQDEDPKPSPAAALCMQTVQGLWSAIDNRSWERLS